MKEIEYKGVTYKIGPSCDLRGVDFSADWQFGGPDIKDVDLSYARFDGANLEHIFLVDLKLNNANLSRANLIKSNLSHADLKYADLSGARLYKTDLSGTKLTGMIIDDGLGTTYQIGIKNV